VSCYLTKLLAVSAYQMSTCNQLLVPQEQNYSKWVDTKYAHLEQTLARQESRVKLPQSAVHLDCGIVDISPDLEIHSVLLSGRSIPGSPPSGRKQSSNVHAIGA